MIKRTYKVRGIHCSSCPLVIEGELEDIGVKARCSYTSEILEVEFNEGILDESKIFAVVKSAGYDLTS